MITGSRAFGHRVEIHEQEPRRPVIELGRLAARLRDLDDVARAVVGHLDLGPAVGPGRPRPSASGALGELIDHSMARVAGRNGVADRAALGQPLAGLVGYGINDGLFCSDLPSNSTYERA